MSQLLCLVHAKGILFWDKGGGEVRKRSAGKRQVCFLTHCPVSVSVLISMVNTGN